MIEGQIIGKYRIVERVGKGGMGTVYRARDETLSRDVAIKILNPELNEPELARRFRSEAVTVARLNHPGIATVFDLFQHDDRWLMAMEFVHGETLDALVERVGALSVDRAVELMTQALAALHYAHGVGVVHRDLKPANLMLSESGVVKIMDFGIARVIGSEHMTTTGLTMGTPAYMAPEQVLGREVDARADLYAMGVVFYRLVTAKLPFAGATPFAIAHSQVQDAPTPVRISREDLPHWIEDVIAHALEKRPEARFQTAQALADAIRKGASGSSLILTDSMSARTSIHSSAAEQTARGAADPAGARAETPVPAQEPSRRVAPVTASTSRARALLVVAVLVLAAAATRVFWRRSPPPATPQAAAAAVPPPPATSAPAPEPIAPTSVAPKRGVEGVSPPSAAPLTAAAAHAESPRSMTTDPLLTFGDLKLLTIDPKNGREGREQDVVLNLAGGQVSIVPKKGGTALQVVPYSQISHATYVNGKRPQWSPGASAPPADLEVPGGGFLGMGSGGRPWLTLQTDTGYLILRLNNNAREILRAIETRTGVKVDSRPAEN
jgi:serine/threonine-protein kinase